MAHCGLFLRVYTRLVVPFVNIAVKGAERLALGVKNLQGAYGRLDGLMGHDLCLRYAEEGRISGLVPLGVGSGSLAEILRGSFHIQQVVDYLEGQADLHPVSAQGGKLLFARLAENRPSLYGDGD